MNNSGIVVSAEKRAKTKRKKGANSQNLSRYNWFTFIPKFAIEQLTQLSTIYFLVIALLQQIPDFSPTGRWGTVLTLTCLICLSFFKEVFEDLRRRSADIKINRRKATVYSKGCEFKHRKWEDVNVGDVVEVSKSEVVPADSVIISSSEPLGTCYLNTASLDGESNLKLRQSSPETSRLIGCDLEQCVLALNISPPSRSLNAFGGTLRTNGGKTEALDLSQFLPRGAKVVNTDWVLAVVVAVGHDTKQLLNALAKPHRKRSNFDRAVNRVIGVLLLILVLTCLALAATHVLIDRTYETGVFLEFLGSFVRFGIMFHNIIPVSLLATVQLVRLVQAHYIRKDIFSEQYNKAAEVQNSQLNEMLGQVKFVLTDKTGTVTKNRLSFRKCSVVGRGVLVPEIDGQRLREEALRGECVQIRDMFLGVCLCHTVVPNTYDGKRTLVGSPDEKAVLQGAQQFGVVRFEGRSGDAGIIVSDCNGVRRTYAVMHVLEYTSERRKMSVIVREETNDGRILIFTKGADSAIFPLLSPVVDGDSVRDIESFASSGLRTMCYAMREIKAGEYDSWAGLWSEAMSGGGDGRKRSLAVAFDSIERRLQFLGITAVEDELQDDVFPSMRQLLEADIFVWMLSGDREENAVSIAKSSGLLPESTPILLLPDCDMDECREVAMEHLDKMREENLDSKSNRLALVVSGRTIGHCQDCPILRESLSKLLMCSRTVICFRVDPWQKAELVNMIKCRTDDVILAIGDGSNDVPMLQTAHIGVAISGVPDDHIQVHGSEATCVADYSIAEFSGLPRLIFVHGVGNSLRMGKMVCYFFYKNVAFYLVQLWYLSTATNWSGQVLFDSLSITLFNLVFTALQPFVLGLFDDIRQQEPAQQQKGFSSRTLSLWLCFSIYHSVVIFFVSQASLGKEEAIILSQCCYSAVLLIVCLKTILESLTRYSLLAILFSMVFYLTYSVTSNFVQIPLSSQQQGVFGSLMTSTSFWALMALIPVMCLLPDIVLHVIGLAWRTRRRIRSSLTSKEDMDTLTRISQTLPRVRTRLLLDQFSRGFAFSETNAAAGAAGEGECLEAFTKSMDKPKKRRPSTSFSSRRTKSNV